MGIKGGLSEFEFDMVVGAALFFHNMTLSCRRDNFGSVLEFVCNFFQNKRVQYQMLKDFLQ